MNPILNTIAPVFLVIFAGYAFARTGLLSGAVQAGLMQFVLRVGIPALLFRTMVDARPPGGETLRLWGVYFGALAVVWLASAAITHFVLRRPKEDQPMVGMSACFGNIVLLGIPIALAIYGPEAATPLAVITSIHTVVLWLTATLHVEAVSEHATATARSLLRELATNLLTNPIIIAILAGTLWRQTGIGLGDAPRATVDLLAQAGVPCALFALGLSLRDFSLRGQVPTLAALLLLKLVALPLLVWVLAFQVVRLDPLWAGVAVLFAACPTGVNAFLLANQYGRVINSTSGAIALGTALSVGTMTALLILIAPS